MSDKLLLKNYLERTFFDTWKQEKLPNNNYGNLEIQISSACPLNCTYCYYSKYGDKLNNPKTVGNRKNIKKNIDILIDWLEENKMFPNIEFFSGEVFMNEEGFYVVEKVMDYFIKYNITDRYLMIPSNFSFIEDEEKTKKVENLIKKGIKNKVYLILSCSIDGKYMDNKNRPYKKKFKRSDEWYDKVFTFCKKYNFGFHPMVYFDGIEDSIKNFNWFMEMFKKYNINWRKLYLLEIRNSGWNAETVKEYVKFLEYVGDFIFTKLKHLSFKEILKLRPLNYFSPLASIGRGIGCSIQSTMQVRLGDFVVSPCHRLAYKELESFKFVVENNKIVDIEPLNLDLYLSIISCDKSTFPFCQDCLIKSFCSAGCLGSNYEKTGDPFFTPFDVCLLEHGKLKGILNSMLKYNRIEEYINLINNNRKTEFLKILEVFNGQTN